MEIHAPHGPTNSFKEFLIHIVIVTVGILIALGLEGIREVVHEHHVVRDARENFRAELEENQQHIRLELENTRAMQENIKQILADPQLRQHPDQFASRVVKIQPSFYFFSSSRWDSALATGAVGLMKVDEVNRYSSSNFLVHSYTSVESEATPIWLSLQAYFAARPNLSQQDLAPGIERLILLRGYVGEMIHVGEQLQDATNRALSTP
jgi:hypothetical protein